MTKSSNAFASQGLGSGREGKRNGEEEFEEGKVPLQTRQAVCHVAVTVPYTPCGIWVPSFKLSLFSSPDF